MAAVERRPTLRALRLGQGLSLQAVARQAHLHRTTLWRIEHDKTTPTPATRWWLAQALNTQPHQIAWPLSDAQTHRAGRKRLSKKGDADADALT